MEVGDKVQTSMKVGDKVQTPRGTGIIIKIYPHNRRHQLPYAKITPISTFSNPKSPDYMCYLFELSPVKPPILVDSGYSFKVSSLSAIDHNEIASTLNRNNKIAYTTTDDPEQGVYVYVHRSVMLKAGPHNYLDLPCGNYCLKLPHARELRHTLKELKEIINRPWSNKKETTIKVRYVK